MSNSHTTTANIHIRSNEEMTIKEWTMTFYNRYHALWMFVAGILIIAGALFGLNTLTWYYRDTTTGLDSVVRISALNSVPVTYELYDTREDLSSYLPPFTQEDLIFREANTLHVPPEQTLSDVTRYLQDKYLPPLSFLRGSKQVASSDKKKGLVFVLVSVTNKEDSALRDSVVETNNRRTSQDEIYLRPRSRDAPTDDHDDDHASSYYHSHPVHKLFGSLMFSYGSGSKSASDSTVPPKRYVLRVITVPCEGRGCYREWPQ